MAIRVRPRRAIRAVARAGLFGLALVGSGSALAGPDDGRSAAHALGQLFASTCLQHAGDASGLRTALAMPPFRRMPERSAHAVLPRPGLAFEVPATPGHLMVLSFDDGWCGDGGTGIDPGTLTNSLSDAVAASAGGTMKMMGVDSEGREQRYLIERPNRKAVALLVLLRPADPTARETDLVQASLFASEMETAAP